MRHEHAGEPSTRELTARLGEQLTTLIRTELALAKAELITRGRQAVMGGGLFAGAGIAGIGACLALIAAAIAGIAVVLPVWASALIVGGALGAAAGLLALLGGRRVARGVPPLQVTTDTIRRDLAELTTRHHADRHNADRGGGDHEGADRSGGS
jgi:hypothetical protein